MRLEKSLLKHSENELTALNKIGLKRVFFGLESGCQRVNDFMQKGVDLNNARQIIRLFRNSGIEVSIGTIVGFPTETIDEARQTLDFIMEMEPYVRTVEINPFRLEKTSTIYQDISANKLPEVHLVSDKTEDLSLFSKYHMKDTVDSGESVSLCNEFNNVFWQTHASDIDWSVLFNYAD